MAGVQGVVSFDIGLSASLIGLKKTVADRESTGLIKLNLMFAHGLEISFVKVGNGLNNGFGHRAGVTFFLFVLQLVLNDFLIEIQKCEFRQLAFKSSVKSFVQAALGDSAAAEAGDDAADVEVGEFTNGLRRR